MKVITSEIFIDILKGEYYQKDSEYSRYYITAETSKEIIIVLTDLRINGDLDFKERIHFPYKVRIRHCYFLNKFNMDDVVFDKEVLIHDVEFNDFVSLSLDANRLLIFKSKFHKGLYFDTGKYGYVGIKSCVVDSIDVFGGIFNELEIGGDAVNSITISDENTFIDKLKFGSSLKNTNIQLEYITLNSLDLSGEYIEDCTVFIENVVLHSICISHFKNLQHLLFHNIQVLDQQYSISNFNIRDFCKKYDISEEDYRDLEHYNQNQFDKSVELFRIKIPKFDKYYDERRSEIFKIKPNLLKSRFEIFNVELGKCEFKNVQLEKFQEVTVIDTELTTIKTFNSTFPTKKVVGNYHSLYEIFNDLFSVAQKKNNKREQADYYQASKNALLNSYLNKYWYKKIPSIISLSFSKFYSNYGNRWTQAVFFAIPLVSIFCFCCMLLFTKYDIEFSPNGWDNFKELLPFYFRFIDITHKINFMDDIPNGVIYSKSLPFIIFDLLGRILIAIGIFETVLAFRKYVRK